jgi:hypothetical protein
VLHLQGRNERVWSPSATVPTAQTRPKRRDPTAPNFADPYTISAHPPANQRPSKGVQAPVGRKNAGTAELQLGEQHARKSDGTSAKARPASKCSHIKAGALEEILKRAPVLPPGVIDVEFCYLSPFHRSDGASEFKCKE